MSGSSIWISAFETRYEDQLMESHSLLFGRSRADFAKHLLQSSTQPRIVPTAGVITLPAGDFRDLSRTVQSRCLLLLLLLLSCPRNVQR